MRITTAIVFSAIGFGSSSAIAADVTASSAIDSVIVFPQGAEVTRIAKVKLSAGEQRLVLPDLPAQAMPGSIRVEGKSTGKLDIGSVDSRRLYVASTDPANSETERKRIEDQIEALRDTHGALDSQVQAAEAQRKLLSNLAEMPKVPQGQNGSGGAPIDWKAIIGTIGEGYVAAKTAEIDARVKLRETDRKIAELQGKLAAFPPLKQERTEVAVNVAAGADQDAEFTVRYQVPQASWTAVYDARLETGSKTAAPKLDLTRRAEITQRTGEPWTNVALALSTTRPSVGASAPDLATETVDYVPDVVPASAPIAAAPPAPRVFAKARGGLRGSIDTADRDSVDVRRDEPVMQEAALSSATITQAPFQAVYGVPGRTTVPPTGELKRVQLLEEAIEPQLVVRTVPKLDAKAYLYAKLVLPKSTALLPGRVALFRDGTFVGTGQLPLLPAGDTYDLGFGADDAIKVKHAITNDKRGVQGLISSSKTDTRSFKISVKNLHERSIGVVVIDNIPVSQQQEIKVTPTSTPAPTKLDLDDKRGVLSWEFSLDPDQEQVIETGYQVVWPGAKAIQYGE